MALRLSIVANNHHSLRSYTRKVKPFAFGYEEISCFKRRELHHHTCWAKDLLR